jgi:cyclopropane-fatty-acyl-phospholipid synthase
LKQGRGQCKPPRGPVAILRGVAACQLPWNKHRRWIVVVEPMREATPLTAPQTRGHDPKAPATDLARASTARRRPAASERRARWPQAALLHELLSRILRAGRLCVIDEAGTMQTYGDGRGEAVVVRLSRRGGRRIVAHGGLGLGEAYMEGDLVLLHGDLWDLLSLVGRNLPRRAPGRVGPMTRFCEGVIRRLRQTNDRVAARRNVSHHYDLSNDLYGRFLDADMQYSCAYFSDPGMTLEAAQSAKKRHLASKLRLSPGLRVLDIGCGWGGMALTLAREHGVRVHGVTLSREQLALAEARAAEAGLSQQVRFTLADYRDVAGSFDRIVSVGMFEHVGAPNYPAFFAKVSDLLTEDGVAVIHSIGRMEPPGVTDPFIRKYIFPGGYIPALSEVTAAVEQVGLWITDIEILRLHYAETLRRWRKRLMAQGNAIAAAYDDRFRRMFEFYLASSELSFRTGTTMVMQIQLARRVDALPITRDYMIEAEQAVSTPRMAAGG